MPLRNVSNGDYLYLYLLANLLYKIVLTKSPNVINFKYHVPMGTTSKV